MPDGDELKFELDPPLTKELRGALLDLWAEVSNAGGAVGFLPPVTTDEIRPVADLTFARIAHGEEHVIVARRGEDMVGFAFLDHRPGPLFTHWATIKRLQVRPDLQGTGLGAALLNAVEDAARGLGLEALHLTVRGETGTEAFYVRHGYEVIAHIPRAIRIAPDEYRDELYLIKQL
ncbi:MAG: GNAT family N-acetyltransferase [Actinomycetota bacterium]